MKKGPLVLLVVAAAVLAGAILWYRAGQPGRGAGERAAGSPAPPTAPPFSLPDLAGNRVSSEIFRGKPTVINFFATWCPPCQQEIPGFVEVYNRYRDRGFELVGIALDTEARGNLAAFVSEHRIGYRVLLGDIETTRAFGVASTIPTTIFVGRDGRIRKVHVGFMDKDAFDAEVRNIL